MKNIDMTPVCNKCGKVAPVDEKMSNQNLVAYRVKDPCECGGKFVPKCLLNKGEQK